MGVPAAGLPESHQGSEVGPQHCPAEGRHGVDPHQAANEGVLAALEQGHNVRTHVVSVLLSEVLNEGGTHPTVTPQNGLRVFILRLALLQTFFSSSYWTFRIKGANFAGFVQIESSREKSRACTEFSCCVSQTELYKTSVSWSHATILSLWVYLIFNLQKYHNVRSTCCGFIVEMLWHEIMFCTVSFTTLHTFHLCP